MNVPFISVVLYACKSTILCNSVLKIIWMYPSFQVSCMHSSLIFYVIQLKKNRNLLFISVVLYVLKSNILNDPVFKILWIYFSFQLSYMYAILCDSIFKFSWMYLSFQLSCMYVFKSNILCISVLKNLWMYSLFNLSCIYSNLQF